MIGSIRAEWLKLSRRISTWLLTLVMLAIVVGLSYFVVFLVTRFAPASPGFTEQARGLLKNRLYPRSFLTTVLSDFEGTGLGGAMILILGALSVGSEYGWGTVKTMFTQRPGRLTVIAAKLVVLLGLLIFYALLLLGAGAASSFVAAWLNSAPVEWPRAVDLVKGFGAGVLMLAVYAGLGAALAVLLRGNALPIGLGLVYALIVEGIIESLGQVDVIHGIQRGLPGANAAVLARSFGAAPPPGAPRLAANTPEQAVMVLAAYVVVFAAVTLVVCWRRDVT